MDWLAKLRRPGPRAAGLLAGLLLLIGATLFTRQRLSGAPAFNGGYQAVVLDNGQVYFGKLTGLGTDYPKMTDVYYIMQGSDATNHDRKNVLVRRGKEWHGPKETYLSARHIIMVEPVDGSSEVGRLIRESQSRQDGR